MVIVTDEMVSAGIEAAPGVRFEHVERIITAALSASPAGVGVETPPPSPHVVVYQTYDGELFLSKDRVLEYCKGRPYALGEMGWTEKKLHDDTGEGSTNAD